jgi:DNA-binding CsgD family transcriptional regulator
MLLSCLSVGIITYILAFALFFRKKTLLEIYFLLFLTFFTLRMVIDTLLFYIAPLFPDPHLFYYLLLLIGRLTLCGSFTFLILFVHKMIDFAGSKLAHTIFFILAAGITVFFVIDFIITHGNEFYAEQLLKGFSPVDFLFYIFLLYPIVMWLIFSRKIRSTSLYKTTRTFVLGIICLYPIFIIEDLFGSITFQVGTTELQLRFFPLYYLFLYLMLLYQGFKNIILGQKQASGLKIISKDFISRFNITDRETEIIKLLLEGFSNQKIADALFISRATVRNHIHNIFEKTGVINRVELARLCSE